MAFIRQFTRIWHQSCKGSWRISKEIWSCVSSAVRKQSVYLLHHSCSQLTSQRIIFANTFESVRHLWIANQSALISRPTLHTFHTVVSSSQGFTIGTSPWDESCKQRRKAAATALNRPAVQTYMPIIDLESNVSIKELLEDSGNGKKDIDPIAYFQRFALNTSLTLNYGHRIDGKIDNELLKEICDVERAISNFRSTSNNWQDYIPLMRFLPKSGADPVEWRGRRDKYMTFLLERLKKQIAEGTDKPCITGNILKDPEAKLNEGMYPPPSDKHKLTNPSRNNVHLPNYGLRRSRHRPRQPHNGTSLSLLLPRSRNPNPRLLRNHESLPRRRCMGTLSR
jgi:hypothetical protein